MNKTKLEQRIEQRANERFETEFKEFIKLINNHPIGNALKVKLGEKTVPLANFGCNWGLLNGDCIKNELAINTNLKVVKDELIQKYESEETDKILERLNSIDYLFQEVD